MASIESLDVRAVPRGLAFPVPDVSGLWMYDEPAGFLIPWMLVGILTRRPTKSVTGAR
jgi:hypothetical protein